MFQRLDSKLKGADTPPLQPGETPPQVPVAGDAPAINPLEVVSSLLTTTLSPLTAAGKL